MAREDLARDSDHDNWSSPRLAGAPVGTAVRPGTTVSPTASTGSALHSIVSVPAGVPTPARASADVRSSADSTRPGLASEFEYSFDTVATAGCQRGI